MFEKLASPLQRNTTFWQCPIEKSFVWLWRQKHESSFRLITLQRSTGGNVSIVDRRESLYHLECQFIKKCCCLSMLCTSLRDWSLSTIGCSSASLVKSASLASSEVLKYSNLSLIMVLSWAALQVFSIRRVMPIVRTEQKFSTNPTHRRLFYPIEGFLNSQLELELESSFGMTKIGFAPPQLTTNIISIISQGLMLNFIHVSFTIDRTFCDHHLTY